MSSAFSARVPCIFQFPAIKGRRIAIPQVSFVHDVRRMSSERPPRRARKLSDAPARKQTGTDRQRITGDAVRFRMRADRLAAADGQPHLRLRPAQPMRHTTASSLASSRTSFSSLPSTITRITGSVPEARRTIRPASRQAALRPVQPLPESAADLAGSILMRPAHSQAPADTSASAQRVRRDSGPSAS